MSPHRARRPWQQESYAAAWRFAARAHRGQTEPVEGLPYLLHLGIVTMETIGALREDPSLDEDLAVQCALLHDVIEDTSVRFEEVAAAFGDRVAQGVAALSKDSTLPKDEQMGDSLRRILLQPREIWIVKMADRTCNLRPPIPAHWSPSKAHSYQEEAVAIVTALGGASAFLSNRLQQKIREYQSVLT